MSDWETVPQEGGSKSPERDRGRDVRLVTTGVAIVLLGWFAFANLQSVRIHFWVTSATAPLIVVILISGALGAAVYALWSRALRRRRSSERP